MAQLDIGNIYTSPLKRAVQTAEIIGGRLKNQPIFEESFKELKLGKDLNLYKQVPVPPNGKVHRLPQYHLPELPGPASGMCASLPQAQITRKE